MKHHIAEEAFLLCIWEVLGVIAKEAFLPCILEVLGLNLSPKFCHYD
jgi:hypothetical protein